MTNAPRPYESYVYAYPHKTAYRPLADRPALRELWADERKDALSLYLHIPFCEVRCGFCNLFTRIGAPDELTTRYLDALDRQATAVADALHARAATGVRFAAAAFGGGTPTFLDSRRAGAAVRHRREADGRRPAGRAPLCGDVAVDRHGRPAVGARRAWGHAGEHRRTELRRGGGEGGGAPAAPLGRGSRAGPDPGRADPGPQHRPHLRHRRPDPGVLGALARRGARLAARGAVPLPAVRTAADTARAARASQ